VRRFRLSAAAAAAAALALAATASVDAATNAGIAVSPKAGKPGDRVTLEGYGWSGEAGCANTVVLWFKQGDRSLRLGEATLGPDQRPDGVGPTGRGFVFRTHIQGFATPGRAYFVGRQSCETGALRRSVAVTVRGEPGDETVRYRGKTRRGGRVSFVVVDGNEVRKFRFVNRCPADSDRGTLVPGPMRIGDVSFSRRGRQFTIFGRFYAGGVVKGHARNRTGDCDSGKLRWTAHRVD
jgi:hypothetical protein